MERSAARGMLSCSPAHAARRSERFPAGEPLVEGANVPSEREDLRPREVELRTGHITPGGTRLSFEVGILTEPESFDLSVVCSVALHLPDLPISCVERWARRAGNSE